MHRIKVLIVDDHAMLRDGIRVLLGVHDDIQIVGEASDGYEAINKALKFAPDIILMDLAMPRMDGLEATRRIKRKIPTAKVLVLTQYEDKQVVQSAVRAGVSGYIPKKALSSELLTAIHVVHGGDSFLYPSVTAALIDGYQKHPEETDEYDQLTAREREILKLIAEGNSSRKISDILHIHFKTVLGHRTSLMKKLDIRNQAELIKYVIRKGILV
jgi:DNA-binding NarL/FixJ family response regulator